MSNIQSNTGTSGVKNVVDTAAANGSFKTFSKALRQAGMVEQLQGKGPFTLFAPTDEAFAKLPAGQLDNLLKPENKAELVDLLNFHVLAGRSTAAEVGKMDAAETINGKSAPVKMSGSKLTIAGAVVTEPDIASSNGVLHGIDKVNIPTKH
jgi:uncharacterized surface protein with fasciclin (FAS1) repeats